MVEKKHDTRAAAMPLPSGGSMWRVAIGIALLAFAAHCNGLANGFIEGYDDDEYVRLNPIVQRGVTGEGIVYAFTSQCGANWHPLTMLSHMLDCTLFGLQPAGHHLTSLLLHSCNSVAVFMFFYLATRQRWHSAAIAALFAVHPIHVESVAFIAQRKDVLSGFFYLLALTSHVRYAGQKRPSLYVWTIVFAMLALMSKPMAVSLPIAMLLLDVWPLKRITLTSNFWRAAVKLVWEKTPIVVLAGISCAITFFVQRSGGAVMALNAMPLHARLANAAFAYLRYVGKFILPVNLSAFYGFPNTPGWEIGLSVTAILAVVAASVWAARERPVYLVGVLWFVMTLLPMIGVVQVGMQSMADRYAYITFLGLYMMLVWGLGEGVIRALKPPFASTIFVAYIALLAGITVHQDTYWRSANTLWAHAIDVEPVTAKPYKLLAKALVIQGKYDEALHYGREAARLQPDASNLTDVGATLYQLGQLAESEKALREALQLSPQNPMTLFNLGVVLCAQKHPEEAEQQFDAITDKPVSYYIQTADVFANYGYFDRAEARHRKAIELAPNDPRVHLSIGHAQEVQGKPQAAFESYSKAKDLDPNIPNIEMMIMRTQLQKR